MADSSAAVSHGVAATSGQYTRRVSQPPDRMVAVTAAVALLTAPPGVAEPPVDLDLDPDGFVLVVAPPGA